MKLAWTAGKCCCPDCRMTYVTYIGGGQYMCWLHWAQLGLPHYNINLRDDQ